MPVKAKGLKSDMVRAYAGCPSLTIPAPNTFVAVGGIPACFPPVALSQYQFGEKGSCKLQIRSNVDAPCNFTPACSNPKFKVTCKAIENPGGTLTNTPGWALKVIFRVTMDDLTGQDMTLIDAPVQLAFPAASNGKLKLRADVFDICGFDPCLVGLPVCSALEVIRAAVLDPEGNVFATLGSSTR